MACRRANRSSLPIGPAFDVIFIDTDVAIAFRDGDRSTRERVLTLEEKPALSMMTRIELENGVHRGGKADAAVRRALLDRILRTFPVEAFTEADVLAYGVIIDALGHDRARTIDRLIAAQAISRDATLITRNGKDFRSIELLRLEVWQVP